MLSEYSFLQPGEQVVLEENASQRQNETEYKEGRLLLTNQRIIFIDPFAEEECASYVILLSQIAVTNQTYGVYNTAPNILCVVTDENITMEFHMADQQGEVWNQRIVSLIQENERKSEARFCSACGKPLNVDSIFCASCGKKVGTMSNAAPNPEFIPQPKNSRHIVLILAIAGVSVFVLAIVIVVFMVNQFRVITNVVKTDTEQSDMMVEPTAEPTATEEVTPMPVVTTPSEELITMAPPDITDNPVQEDIIFNLGEYSIILPGYWKDIYLYEEGAEYIIFRQKSSYESMGDGMLFSISSYMDDSYLQYPDYTVLGSSKGKTYVLSRPTDVSFDYENDMISAEYSRMSQDIQGIITSFTIMEEDTTTENQSNYILPTSNSEYLTKTDLLDLTKKEARFARNEIYARYGRKFKDEELQAYFDACTWYVGIIESKDFNEDILNEYEKANAKLIKQYEKDIEG